MNISKELSPIGVSAYCRLDHLKKTINALKNNEYAKDSNLYIFSDGPGRGYEEKVKIMRSYIDIVDGFKNVTLIKRKRNNRVYNNREGMQYLLNKYGKMIWLEEDIVTSRYFLMYMNDALNIYEHDERIISIAGYCPPIKIRSSYSKDTFILKRFNAWGFGTWKHKFDPFSFTIDLETYRNNIEHLRKKFSLYGKDVLDMIWREAIGDIDALDVKVMYHQILNDMYTVYPIKSMSLNIGHDGTGLHCGSTKKYDVQLSKKKLNLETIKKEDKYIISNHKKFRNSMGNYFMLNIYNKIKGKITSINSR
ncbi:MAG: hypothetical protein WDZ80_06160 [Candidatus Paceibacterota bacterium]